MQPHNLTHQVRRHDRYDANGHVDMTGRYHAPEEPHACCATSEATSSP